MAKLLNTETKQLEEVADNQVSQALATGTHQAEDNALIPVVSEDGTKGTIRGYEAPAAFANPDSGVRYRTKAELFKEAAEKRFGGAGGVALSTIAGFARAGTLGASDQVLTKTGLVAPDTLKQLEAANPVATGIGEVAAYVLPGLGEVKGAKTAVTATKEAAQAISKARRASEALEATANVITTPSRLLTKAGQTVERRTANLVERAVGADAQGIVSQLVKKAVPLAAQGGVEGAGMGVQQVLTEDALGDHEIAAEHALATIGLSALTGVGLGGAMGAASVAGKRLVRTFENVAKIPLKGKTPSEKVKDLLTPEALEAFAQERSYKALGPFKADVKRAGARGDQRLNEIGKDLLDHGVWSNTTSREEALEMITAKKEAFGQRLGDVLTQLDEHMTTTVGAEREALQRRISETQAQGKAQLQLLESQRAELAATLPTNKAGQVVGTESRYGHGTGTAKKLEALDAEIAEVKAGAGKRAQSMDSELKRLGFINTEDIAQRAEREILNPLRAQVAVGNDPIVTRLEREIAAIRAKGEQGLTLTEGENLKRGYDKFLKFGAEPTPIQESLQDLRRIVKNEVETKAQSVADATSDALSKDFKELKRVYGNFAEAERTVSNRLEAIRANRTISPSTYGTGIGSAVVASAGGLGGIGSAAVGAATGYVNKLGIEYGNQVLAVNARKLAALAKAKGQSEALMNSSIKSFFDRAVGVAKELPASARRAALSVEATDRRKESASLQDQYDHWSRIADVASDPDTLATYAANVTDGLSSAAPSVAPQLQLKGNNALAYLNTVRPKEPGATYNVNPNTRHWRPSYRDMAKFVRIAKTVDDPTTVWRAFDKGALTSEQVAALRAVYPKKYEKFAAGVQGMFAKSKTVIPSAQRVQLSILMGVPFDSRMTPQGLRSLQATFAQKPQQPARRPSPSGVSGTAQRSQTFMEKLALK